MRFKSSFFFEIRSLRFFQKQVHFFSIFAFITFFQLSIGCVLKRNLANSEAKGLFKNKFSESLHRSGVADYYALIKNYLLRKCTILEILPALGNFMIYFEIIVRSKIKV